MLKHCANDQRDLTTSGMKKVRGVINLCEEYRGPLRKYKELGMEQLHLPTTDHFEPTVDDLMVRRVGDIQYRMPISWTFV